MILTVYEFKMSEKIPLATTSCILKVDEPDAMKHTGRTRCVLDYWRTWRIYVSVTTSW